MADAATLQQENAALRDRLTRAEQQLDAKTQRIRDLEELLLKFKHRAFGASSEQSPPGQDRLFDESEVGAEALEEAEAETVAVAGHSRKRTRRPRLSDDLPRVEIIHDLDPSEKICPEHGCDLTPMGEEVSEQLEFIPATVEVERHICKKYTCPECEGRVVTATKPPQPIPKSVASPNLLSWVAVSKYADALPLYRQCQIFARLGFEVDRTTLARWMVACGRLIQPLVNLLWDKLRQERVVHMDETTVQVLAEAGKTPQSKSYMWVSVAGPPDGGVVLFHYAPGRGGQVAKDLLAGYHGALMVDGYEGYGAACTEQITRLGCWAHARRRFIEAQRLQPKGKTGKPDQALSWIGRLYGIERALRAQQERDGDLKAEDVYQARQAQALPILGQLRSWLDKTVPVTAPESALGKAVGYLDQQWPRLVRYVEDGHYPIDNNRAENAVRPFVVGRKNWLFSQSTDGVKASANLYSLIETAKAHGLEPHAYLARVLAELPQATTVEQIEALLPANVKNGE
jgi:transposase